MNTEFQLQDKLRKIHRKSYPAYKDLKGSYRFPDYILHIEHVQGDPFAAPSKLSVELSTEKAGFPVRLFDKSYKKTALEDYLIRAFGQALSTHMFQAKGSGKSGLMSISRCGQQVLSRTALRIDEKRLLVRFEVGFPANGRTINSTELEKILYQYLPDCVRKALYYRNLDADKLEDVVNLAEDQHSIREELTRRNLAAFIANGSVLPRENGISDKPMKGAVAFRSPKSMEVVLTLPHKGNLAGMGIPRGITLIVGGGYHGKSTLLKALERGVYNHIRGDGREYVITDSTAMKIRAEDGRAVSHVNISPFINHLPNGKDTVDFSTEDASGSTSQAANVVEALDSGAKTLLIDEDTSATNFMVRDALMQSVIARDKEPITPFIDQARTLYEKKGVSIILVAGSSGAYFSIADHILQMDTYLARDITEKVRQICGYIGQMYPVAETEAAEDLSSWSQQGRTLRVGRLERKHDQIKIKQSGKDSFSLGRETVDLKYVEQIVDSEQAATLSYVMRYVAEQLEKNPGAQIGQILGSVCNILEKNGPVDPARISNSPGNLAQVRSQEIYACINRYRGFR